MPELPEVETIAQELQILLQGKKIQAVEILRESIVRSPLTEFQAALVGRKISKVKRRAKFLIFSLEDKKHPNPLLFLVVHLRMTGQFAFQTQPHLSPSQPFSALVYPQKMVPKNQRILFDFGKETLIYYDQRALGQMAIFTPAHFQLLEKKWGVEPLGKEFTCKRLQNIIHKRKISLKTLLLDQKAIAGIGNIYASEILFAAGLHPKRIASSLNAKEAEGLHFSLLKILKMAIAEKGTTFRDYKRTRQQTGNFQNFLKVYGRAGKTCFTCKDLVQKIKQNQRSTFFCPQCQPMSV